MEVTMLNPCLNADKLLIQGPVTLPDMDYTVGDQIYWNIPGFEVTSAQTNLQGICGTLEYTIEASLMTDFLTFYSDSDEMQLYAYDLTVLDGGAMEYSYTITARLAEYPLATQFHTASGVIRLIDPCTDPQFIVGTPEPVDNAYYDSAVFTSAMAANPPICEQLLQHECVYASGPYEGGLNLCDFILDTLEEYVSTGSFDPDTGTLDIILADKDTFPEGEYVFEITSEQSDTVYDSPYVLKISDPCPGMTASIDNDPFAGKTYTYDLFNPAVEVTFNSNDIGSHDAEAFCGKPSVQFLTEAGSPVMEDFFIADYEGDKFALMTSDWALAGEYKLMFKFFFAQQPKTYVLSEVFTVQINNICLTAPVMLTPPTLAS